MADLKAMALILGGMLLAFPALASPVCATDDLGKEICLEQPAERIAAIRASISSPNAVRT